MVTFYVLLLASFASLSTGSYINQALNNIYLSRYGVVLDAGSTGTRVRVFHYTLALDDLHFKNMEEIANMKMEPGLSQLNNNQDVIRSHITELIDFAKGNVPIMKWSITDILIFATAGMRSIHSRDEAENIMDTVRSVLANSSTNPFSYKHPSQVQIISGEEEGVYAWVALNYLQGVFDCDDKLKKTFGVMEMGGASIQIAFLPEREPLDEEYAVTIAGRKFSLYVHSYLGFGQEGIVEKMTGDFRSPATVDNTGIVVKENPCFLEGDAKTETLTSGETVKYIGTGNTTLCREDISKHMHYNDATDAEEYCNPSPCAILDTYQPHISPDMIFYAFGGAERVIDHFGFDQTLNITLLRQASSDYCTLSLQQAKEKFPDTPEKYLSNRCLLGEYVSILLSDQGLGPFGPVVKATSKVNDLSADWTLGALMVDQYESLSGVRSARTFGVRR